MTTRTVLLFAAIADALGAEQVPIPDGVATAGDLRRALARAHRAHAALIERCGVAIDERWANDEDALDGARAIALLPPVSGG